MMKALEKHLAAVTAGGYMLYRITVANDISVQ